MQAIIEAAIAANNQRNEQIIRHLLGRWVSELKPAIAYDQGGKYPRHHNGRGRDWLNAIHADGGSSDVPRSQDGSSAMA